MAWTGLDRVEFAPHVYAEPKLSILLFHLGIHVETIHRHRSSSLAGSHVAFVRVPTCVMSSILNQKVTMMAGSIELRLFRVQDDGRPSAPKWERYFGSMSAADSLGRSSARSGLRKSGTQAVSRSVVPQDLYIEAGPASSNDDVAPNEDHDNPDTSPREDPAPPRPSSPDVAAEKERPKFGSR
jgi:hypothetical protein